LNSAVYSCFGMRFTSFFLSLRRSYDDYVGRRNSWGSSAKAIKWMSINIRRYGGDPSRITLVGFSSGAHLAALLACDPGYLQRYRLTNSVIAQVICLDGAHFDVPLAIRMLAEQGLGLAYQDRRVRKLRRLMGEDEERQRRLSPAGHPLTALAGTRFLLLSAGVQGGAGRPLPK
ncbi:carboxylesterase family protein, partial [Thauera aromatica]|uniref:alpha/beta hydrolase n=1 Tax=Thauera aromatica TaxID=59405 RepID=UPI001FFDAD60